MSDLRLNLRILMWHLQISVNWRVTWTYNDYHRGLKHGWFALPEYKNFFKKNGIFFTR